jgi:hypothetical protein
VVALKEYADPGHTPVITVRHEVGKKRRSPRPGTDCVAPCDHDRKQSETPYILFVAFDIKLIPLATRDLRSLSMNSGDYAC